MASKAFALVVLALATACQPLEKISNPVGPVPSPAATASVGPTAPAIMPTPSVQQLMEPFTLAGLREHQFVSGRIRITKVLDKTDVFTRYLISYGSDGLNINGIMQIPAQGHAPFPVVIMNHGFFDRAEYASGDGTDRAAEYLNQHGYLTLASDYRSWGRPSTSDPASIIPAWRSM